MNFDTAYIDPLSYGWIEHIQETIKEEQQSINCDKNNYAIPFIAIPESTIKVIFIIANYLDIKPEIKYTVVYLYDKFMYKYFWELYNIETDPSEESWDKVSKNVSSQSKLYLMICFQLACKMNSCIISIEQILQVLHMIDEETTYTQNVIIASEFQVFKIVEFKMPFCTPFHCIEILLAITGLIDMPNLYNVALAFLDIAMLQHETIYFHFQEKTQGNIPIEFTKEQLLLKSDLLFFSTVIVFCAIIIVSPDKELKAPVAIKLAKLINTKDTEKIYIMSDILITIIAGRL